MSPVRLELRAPAKGRIGTLDELKGVAIILVVLYHAGGVLGMEDVMHGELGVDMFVILSGIGLSLSTSAESAGRFLVRRFWRIYPAYWIALTAFIAADMYFKNLRFTTPDILLHYVGLHGWFGDRYAMSINDSFWFITLIVTLYLLYPLLRRLVNKPDRLLLAGAVISLVLSLCYLHWSQPVGFAHLSLRMPGFFLGLLAGRLLRDGHLEVPMTMALGAAALLIFYVPYTQGFLFSSVWIGCAVMAGYAFLLRPVVGARARSVLTFLGDRSLEIFLIHQPLIREYNVFVLQRYFPNAGLGRWVLTAGMCVGIAVTIELSSLLRRLLSKLPGSGRRAPAPSPG
jgi:peptidoglycan/LPS O-acetylase OafA/YrhL